MLHLDDCPINFNVDNLSWHDHAANLLLKLSKGTANKSLFHCFSVINGKNEGATSCTTTPEAQHAVDVLKYFNVAAHLRELVFKHGLNFKYPSQEVLISRRHLYKNKPGNKGKPRKVN